MTNIIGFGHKRQSGKDTAYKILLEAFEHRFYIRRFAFADALKAESDTDRNSWTAVPLPAEFAGCSVYRTSTLRESLEEKRTRYQKHGEERRSENPHYWVDHVAAAIRQTQPQFAIITDVRFKNEVGWIRGNRGLYVRLDRLNYERNEDVDRHISEHDLDNVEPDYSISASNVAELKEKIIGAFLGPFHFHFYGWKRQREFLKEHAYADL